MKQSLGDILQSICSEKNQKGFRKVQITQPYFSKFTDEKPAVSLKKNSISCFIRGSFSAISRNFSK